MSKVPEAMKCVGRLPDQTFDQSEMLFRRVHPHNWESNDIVDVASVELPDISVKRSRYSHPEWARHDTFNGRHWKKWGVIGIVVSCIPTPVNFNQNNYQFVCTHDPMPDDYPHSEIVAFLGDSRLPDIREILSEEVHLLWRELLLQKIKLILKPNQKCEDRTEPPQTHLVGPVPTA